MQEKIKRGYKQTEVGVIPEDWDIEPLGQLFEIQLGKMLDEEKNSGIPKPYVGNRAVQWGRIDATELPRMKMSSSDLVRFRLKNGDILVCEGGEIGRSAIWRSEVEECYYQKALHRLRPTVNFDRRLILAIFQSYAERGLFANYVTQTSIAHLPKEKLVGLPIPVPPPDEQRAIAEALADADVWIAELEAVIAKKRDLKQAAMQQLLTGEIRLPGFSGKWEVKRLGELAVVVGGGTPKSTTPEYWDGGIYWCTPTDITGTEGKYLEFTERTISAEGLKKSPATLLPAGSLLLCTRATLGEVRISKTSISTNQGFKSLVCSPGTSNEFLYYMLLTMKQAMVEKSSGSTFLEISKRDVISLESWLPAEPEEQTAIAEILSDMDADLAALKAEATKARAIKQGMMQTLLTGQVRLV